MACLYDGKQKSFMKKLHYILIILLLAIIIVPALMSTAKSQFKVTNSSTNKIKVSTLQKGLVGHWDMDQTSLKSSTVLADRTPNANNGTLVGSPTFTTDRNNQSNKAMSYSGSGQYINSGDPTNGSLDFGSGNFTLSAWVKTNTLNSAYHCVITKNANSYPNYQLCINASNVFQAGYEVSVGNISRALSGSLSTNTWYNTVVVADRTNGTSLYLNGILIQTVSAKSGSLDNVANLLIGRHVGGSALDWNGSIDDVRIYNRALSQAEVTQLYGSYNPKIQVSTLQQGLVGYWPLDQDSLKSSTVVADKTPYANNGTMVGSPTFTTDQKGQASKAMSFNGTSQYIDTGASSTLDGFTTMSISSWFKTSTEDMGVLVGKHPGGSGPYYLGGGTNISGLNTIRFMMSNSSGIRVNYDVSNSSYYNGSWHFLVGVYDGSTMYIYFDGTPIGLTTTQTGSVRSMTSNFIIGDWQGHSNKFNGSIADVRIYNRALSASEVKALYELYE